MLKRSLLRGACSYCVCVTVAALIALMICLLGDGMVAIPEFTARMGGDPLTAALVQILLIGLIGFAFGAGSVLFEIEHWSFLRQGAVHLTLTAAVWIAVELICFTPITLPAMLSMGLSVVATYALTWGSQYFVWKNKVRRLNDQIRRKNEEDFDECR